MTALIRPDRLDRVAWLALSGLAVIAFVLIAGIWIVLSTGDWETIPQRLVNACLLISKSLAESFWSWVTAHPLTAFAVAFLTGSMGWAVLRLGLSLLAGCRLGRRLAAYQAGHFPVLDGALRLAPEVRPAGIRILRAKTPEAFTLGLIRPKICLSAGLLQSMTEAEIGAVLRHEHAHVISRDPIRLAAVRLFSDFLWFLPIARTLADAFSGLAEFRADEAALSAGSDSLELASAIVKTARGASSGPRLVPALGSLALVEQRVMRLLGKDRTIRVAIPWGPALASGLAIMAFVALLIGPALGAAGSHAVGPAAAMQSMMSRCTMGNSLGPPMSMSHCGESGSVPAAGRKGVGT